MINFARFISTQQPEIAGLACQAMIDEVHLTPKPGLVDQHNNGAHHDMDLALFMRSIAAIEPWLQRFYQLGIEHVRCDAPAMLELIRPVGIACEQAMFTATGGVNTHKGGIFSLGLLCVAGGRLTAMGVQLTRRELCRQVSKMTCGLVARELTSRRQASTAGERLYQRWGLTGARGEAESGFHTVVTAVLPYWRAEQPVSQRLHTSLLRLMAVNPDTNLASRGGMEGMRFVQDYARRLLTQGWDIADLERMDQALIARHLSPGGSADLLAVAQLLAAYPAGYMY